MTTREIQGYLRQIYGFETSPDLISTITDAVLEEMAEWRNGGMAKPVPLIPTA